jgi:hypothetical protein
MVLNLYLEKRLADQRMHDALCAAKLDCLLRGQFQEAKKHSWRSPVGLVLLPLMVLVQAIQIGVGLLKGHSS